MVVNVRATDSLGKSRTPQELRDADENFEALAGRQHVNDRAH
jgi:hypothetical protein